MKLHREPDSIQIYRAIQPLLDENPLLCWWSEREGIWNHWKPWNPNNCFASWEKFTSKAAVRRKWFWAFSVLVVFALVTFCCSAVLSLAVSAVSHDAPLDLLVVFSISAAGLVVSLTVSFSLKSGVSYYEISAHAEAQSICTFLSWLNEITDTCDITLSQLLEEKDLYGLAHKVIAKAVGEEVKAKLRPSVSHTCSPRKSIQICQRLAALGFVGLDYQQARAAKFH